MFEVLRPFCHYQKEVLLSDCRLSLALSQILKLSCAVWLGMLSTSGRLGLAKHRQLSS